LYAGAVGGHGLFKLALDGGVVPVDFHIDEVNHHQPAQIAQTQLARNFFGGFKVGFQRRALDMAFLGGTPGVHVDGNQRLGRVDHDIPA